MRKKNDLQSLGGLAGPLSVDPVQNRSTLVNTASCSVCSSQVDFVQGDLFSFEVVHLDLFGYDTAGGWRYD